MEPLLAGILLFDDVEVLDFAGAYEVFSITRPSAGEPGDAPLRIALIAREPVVTSISGMRVLADYGLNDCPALDLLLIPGGPGVHAACADAELRSWVQARAAEARALATVCTGTFLPAHAGLLGGKRVTTHWQSLNKLRAVAPDAEVVADQRVVVDGNLYSSGGVTAGIDLALRIVGDLLGEDVAQRAAERMEYFAPGDGMRVKAEG